MAYDAVYLDYNASAPLDPRVAEAMLPALTDAVGNAASSHRFGRFQTVAVDKAREQVAALVGARPGNVIFTSGATEANNLALKGITETAPPQRSRILISAVEHASIRRVAEWLEINGICQVDRISVTPLGFTDIDELKSLLRDDVLMVSVMAANSETGILNPIAEIADLAHEHGSLMHCDATQMVGRSYFDAESAGVDLTSISAHKIYGPQGVGALVGTSQSLKHLTPQTHGGGQEQGLRSGSMNVAGAVGLGFAAELACEEHGKDADRIAPMRDHLVTEIQRRLPDVTQNGDVTKRLPNTANLHFSGANSDAVVSNMDPVAVSTGSACSAGVIEPSQVLLAMGLSDEAASESVRFSLGRFTTPEDIETAIERTVEAVTHVRSLNDDYNKPNTSDGEHHEWQTTTTPATTERTVEQRELVPVG